MRLFVNRVAGFARDGDVRGMDSEERKLGTIEFLPTIAEMVLYSLDNHCASGRASSLFTDYAVL